MKPSDDQRRIDHKDSSEHGWQRQPVADWADGWTDCRCKGIFGLLQSEQPLKVMADKAYDAAWLLHYPDSKNIEGVIPPKKSRLEQRTIDYTSHKERNLIERTINRMKQYRKIATRYEKTDSSFLALCCFESSFVNLSL